MRLAERTMADRRHPEHDGRHLDDVERLMLDLRDAERAGVFGGSTVDESVLTGRVDVPRMQMRKWRLPVGLAVAASVTFGVLFFRYEVREIEKTRQRTMARAQVGSFIDCFRAGAAADECAAHDADADRDLDLADFARFQQAFGGAVRTN